MSAKRAVLLFFLAIYLFTVGGHTYSTDEETMFFVTAAIARRGDFDLPGQQEAPISTPMIGVGDKLYSPYGILPSALALPLYFVGSMLARFFPLFYNGFFLRFLITLFLNPLVTALTMMLFMVFLLNLGYQLRIALVTVFMYGLATMAWVYSKTYFSEPLGTFLLTAAFLALYRFRQRPNWQIPVVSGICLGLAVATKVAAVIVLPVFLIYLLWILFKKHGDKGLWKSSLALAEWGLGLAVPIGLVLLYNFARFADPFQTGYGESRGLFGTPLYTGLYGLLLSPGKSLFLYSPVTLLAIPALWKFGRQHAPEALVCLGLIVTHLGFYSVYSVWHGDSAWGPRFLVFILPFLLLPTAALLEWLAHPARWRWRLLVGVVCILSLLVQITGIISNFDIYINMGVPSELRFYDANWSPLIGQWRVLINQLANGSIMLPMPEGAIARFGWFFDPAYSHPLDFWYLYLLYSGMPPTSILFLVIPVITILSGLLIWSSLSLYRLWQEPPYLT